MQQQEKEEKDKREGGILDRDGSPVIIQNRYSVGVSWLDEYGYE